MEVIKEDIKRIAVIGAGNMGHQIALQAALSGFGVKCSDVSDEALKKAEAFVADYLPGLDGLPQADVLKFTLATTGSVVVRPSGTEPKLKVYLTYWGENGDTMEKLCAHFDAWAR